MMRKNYVDKEWKTGNKLGVGGRGLVGRKHWS